MKEKIILTDVIPTSMSPDSEELAKVIVKRTGLVPRKKGSTDKMFKVLILMYEMMKRSNQNKRPEQAIVTVEEMGNVAGITRQTMYEYLTRWTDLELISKTSYIWEGKVIIGYKLNGNTLEQAFERSAVKIKNNLEMTIKYVRELQSKLKNEKLSEQARLKKAIIA
ncbi:hypothetical protein C0585_06190 [Candidatus Woesearchaeota archaeon]|nr:MAG: hypothetical protein C0585_06190 [Candidatus Woesearchaeota archaeon]